MGAQSLQLIQNSFEHRRRFLEYLIVPKSQNPISISNKSCIATRVIFHLFLMLASVKLNYQHCFNAHKICDVPCD